MKTVKQKYWEKQLKILISKLKGFKKNNTKSNKNIICIENWKSLNDFPPAA